MFFFSEKSAVNFKWTHKTLKKYIFLSKQLIIVAKVGSSQETLSLSFNGAKLVKTTLFTNTSFFLFLRLRVYWLLVIAKKQPMTFFKNQSFYMSNFIVIGAEI